MFFGTYIFAEKHIFFVRPLLEHDVYEKVPCKKHIFFVRPLLEHDVYEKVPYEKYMFFHKYIRSKKHMFFEKVYMFFEKVYMFFEKVYIFLKAYIFFVRPLLVHRTHGRFTIDDTGGAAHSCAAGHTTCDKKVIGQKLKICAKKARAANKRRVAFLAKIATR